MTPTDPLDQQNANLRTQNPVKDSAADPVEALVDGSASAYRLHTNRDEGSSVDPGQIFAAQHASAKSFHFSNVFFGDQCIRSGWSIAVFIVLFLLFTAVAFTFLTAMHLLHEGDKFSLQSQFFGELAQCIALIGALLLITFIEQRHILDFNLRDNRGKMHFLSGTVTGFAVLSALVGVMTACGWMHFGPVALSGKSIVLYAIGWGATFLLVGCVEEGLFRCYLQFTLTRGINFWWATGFVATLCLILLLIGKGEGRWGVYILALLGAAPCLALHLKRAPNANFWQAAWAASTLFGFVHTGNSGENWIGIFAAAGIGFVFCVSVRVTGSAWWAIGCHAAWDWAQTFFYGTADSGLPAQGHFLTTSPSGSALWSGGADGPEGSLLILPTMLLILACVVLLHGRNKTSDNMVDSTTR